MEKLTISKLNFKSNFSTLLIESLHCVVVVLGGGGWVRWGGGLGGADVGEINTWPLVLNND